MPTDVIMPALGMAQDTGKLIRWIKSEGDQVTKGEPLMEVETDKATVEVEAPATGTLAGVTAAEGDDITVGYTIAVILAPGEQLIEQPPPRQAGKVGSGEQSPPRQAGRVGWGESVSAEPSEAVPGRSSASPKARRLAAERGLDLSKVVGSGPGGAVLEEDVLQAARPSTAAAPPESALWRAMAKNVSRSWSEAPHFFVMREVDASALVDARSRQTGDVTYTDLLVNAVASALTAHPRMNASRPEVNIGLAVAVPDGLIVPVIHGADGLTVGETAARRGELLERVRAGKLRPDDLSGATFTLSNLGMYGVDLFTAILTEGQAGILAVGRIADRVVAHGGAPAVRPTMMISLSCDHRQVDGARAAEFVQTLVERLEGPSP